MDSNEGNCRKKRTMLNTIRRSAQLRIYFGFLLFLYSQISPSFLSNIYVGTTAIPAYSIGYDGRNYLMSLIDTYHGTDTQLWVTVSLQEVLLHSMIVIEIYLLFAFLKPVTILCNAILRFVVKTAKPCRVYV